ncbi:MAG: GDSL-type esterase/lipase family protein [Nitrospirota bacterium]
MGRNKGAVKRIFRTVLVMLVLIAVSGFAHAGEIIAGSSTAVSTSISQEPDNPGMYINALLQSRTSTACTWHAELPQSGTYNIYMWWPETPSRSASVPVTIQHASGTHLVSVDQQRDGDAWNYLGSFHFDAQKGGTVTLTFGKQKEIRQCAESVQFVAVPSGGAPVAVVDSVSPNRAAAGTTVTLAGHGIGGDGVIVGYHWKSNIDGDLGTSPTLSTSLLSPGEHTVSLMVQDASGTWSAEATAPLAVAPAVTVQATTYYYDDFSTNTLSRYTVTNTWMEGGIGKLLYDAYGKRLKVQTGDNIGLTFSRSGPALGSAVFSLSFLPVKKYPYGGYLRIRLKQDQNNYYELYNTDGYGPGYLKKVVAGRTVQTVYFSKGYVQNVSYTISISFAPTSTQASAFGQTLKLSAGGTITVNRFEIETAQQDAYYDTISTSSSSPPPSSSASVKITQPLDRHLQVSRNLTVKVTTANIAPGWGIKFTLDRGTAIERSLITKMYPYEVTFANCVVGEHTLDADVVNSDNALVSGQYTHDAKTRIGIGDYYVGFGDSLTKGYGDNDAADNVSKDGRNSGGGYEPVLNDLLTGYKAYPHTVANEGVNGDESIDGASIISQILVKHPGARYFLVMYGTNDARLKRPSGKGLSPGARGYSGSYKDYMQRIITAIKNKGIIPILAKIPITYGECMTCTFYSDPRYVTRNALIRDYNIVIDELVRANGLPIRGPDFYTYFSTHRNEYFDPEHLNGTGYRSMAQLWANVLRYVH